mmetsp:Transcript_59229/g.162514  ORF Transcript_59229/g.162514 Transcript_59229/m.162514 type:complete len:132 (+) Transcript_59229:325-720(+)
MHVGTVRRLPPMQRFLAGEYARQVHSTAHAWPRPQHEHYPRWLGEGWQWAHASGQHTHTEMLQNTPKQRTLQTDPLGLSNAINNDGIHKEKHQQGDGAINRGRRIQGLSDAGTQASPTSWDLLRPPAVESQ